MSTKRSLLTELARMGAPVLILACGIGGFLVFGQKPEIPKKEIDTDKAVGVQTVRLENFQGNMTLEAEGVAVPFRQVAVSAEVGGRIIYKSSNCRSGNYVAAREPLLANQEPADRKSDLIRIDTTDYQLDVARLDAQFTQATEELAAVGVDLNSTESLIDLAKELQQLRAKELNRDLQIAKQNSLTERQVDESRRHELSARNSLQTLKNQKAQLEQKKKTLAAAKNFAKAQLDRANADLSRTRLGAPIDGTIVVDFFEQNDYVKKGDPLFKINDTSRAEVKCNLRFEDVYWIWLQSGKFAPGKKTESNTSQFQLPKTPVNVVFTFKGVEYVWDGMLSRFEGSGLDGQTQTVPCRVLIKEPTKVRVGKRSVAIPRLVLPMLFTGLYVKIRIPIRPPMPLFKIPAAALRPGNKIWIAAGGKLKIVNVHVARATDDGVLIFQPTDGSLRTGHTIISSPLASAVNGMRVKQVDVK